MDKYYIFYQPAPHEGEGFGDPKQGYYIADETAHALGYYDDYYDALEEKFYTQIGWHGLPGGYEDEYKSKIYYKGDKITINDCSQVETDENGNLIYGIEMSPIWEETNELKQSNKYYIYYNESPNAEGFRVPKTGYYSNIEYDYVAEYYEDYQEESEGEVRTYTQIAWEAYHPNTDETWILHEGDRINIDYCTQDDIDENGNFICCVEMRPVWEKVEEGRIIKTTVTFKALDSTIPSGGVFDQNNVPDNPYDIQVSYGSRLSTLEMVHNQSYFTNLSSNIPNIEYDSYEEIQLRFQGWQDRDGNYAYGPDGLPVEGKYWKYDESLEKFIWIWQKDVTLYDNCVYVEQCRITYYPNYAGDEHAKYDYVYELDNYIISNSFYGNEDSHLLGWNTQPDGSGASYQNEEKIIVPRGGLTLYAQWGSKNIPIIFNTFQINKIVYNNKEITHLVFNGIEIF